MSYDNELKREQLEAAKGFLIAYDLYWDECSISVNENTVLFTLEGNNAIFLFKKGSDQVAAVRFSSATTPKTVVGDIVKERLNKLADFLDIIDVKVSRMERG